MSPVFYGVPQPFFLSGSWLYLQTIKTRLRIRATKYASLAMRKKTLLNREPGRKITPQRGEKLEAVNEFGLLGGSWGTLNGIKSPFVWGDMHMFPVRSTWPTRFPVLLAEIRRVDLGANKSLIEFLPDLFSLALDPVLAVRINQNGQVLHVF